MRSAVRHASGQLGIATVTVIFFLVLFILPIFALVLDITYLYLVRGQMHNAADAAALAGARELDRQKGPDEQDPARQKAGEFALKNTADAEPVLLLDDGSNSYSGANDITVGHWDGSAYQAGATPVNAIQVWSRRTQGSPSGEFGLFWGRFISTADTPGGYPFLRVGAFATAVIPEKVEAPLSICIDATVPENVNLPHLFYWAPYSSEVADQGQYGIAWTLFSTNQATPTKELVDFFCDKPLGKCPPDPVYSSNGFVHAVAREFRCAFYNPDHDRAHKTFDPPGSNKVSSWRVLVPVFDRCPPGEQPKAFNIRRFSWVTVTDVFATVKPESFCACGELASRYPLIFTGIFKGFPKEGSEDENFPRAIRISAIEPGPTLVNSCPVDRAAGVAALVQ